MGNTKFTGGYCCREVFYENLIINSAGLSPLVPDQEMVAVERYHWRFHCTDLAISFEMNKGKSKCELHTIHMQQQKLQFLDFFEKWTMQGIDRLLSKSTGVPNQTRYIVLTVTFDISPRRCFIWDMLHTGVK